MIGNEIVIDKFVVIVEECRKEINTISDIVEDHFLCSPNNLNYGHISEATWVLNSLKEISDFLLKK